MVESTAPGPRAGRALRVVATTLLVLWGALGLWETARALVGPIGITVDRPASMAGSVGLPLEAATEVTAIRSLLAHLGDAPLTVQVLYPTERDPLALLYVQQQLAHLEYPRWVEVRPVTGSIPADVGAVIAAPGVGLQVGAPLAEHGGFRLFVRPAP